jgi:hypothetical protein
MVKQLEMEQFQCGRKLLMCMLGFCFAFEWQQLKWAKLKKK